ncbi:MAG: FG-GAP repeat protein [Planctomycetota bacterium]|nr:FG-GAP repeat protein [Planctomycetota bacterium]
MIQPAVLLFSFIMSNFFTLAAGAQCTSDPGPKLLASDGAAGDAFGLSVEIDGSIIAIGAIWDDDHGFNSGSVYVYVLDNQGVWGETFKIVPADGDPEDVFGRSVAVGRDTILVGANGDDDNGFDAGAGYVFVQDGDSWVQQAKLLANDGAAVDSVGWRVDLDGDTAVLSAHRDDDAGSSSGAAYVFVRDAKDNWTQEAKLTASDAAAGDEFGHDVAVSGDTIFVGAYKDDDHGSSSGSVYIFERDADDRWLQIGKLTASDANAGYHYGRFLDLSGDTALIGSPFHHPLNFGAAYVIRRVNGVWSEETMLTADVPTTQEWFGSSVSIDGEIALIGSFYGEGNHPGEAYVFHDVGDAWTLVANPTAFDGSIGDGFGRTVALHGGNAVVGASANDDQGSGSGSAYTFWIDCPGRVSGDLNGDGVVGILDLLILLATWGPCDPPCPPACLADIDASCTVDILDLLILLASWG